MPGQRDHVDQFSRAEFARRLGTLRIRESPLAD
jgi:hypothetical protein